MGKITKSAIRRRLGGAEVGIDTGAVDNASDMMPLKEYKSVFQQNATATTVKAPSVLSESVDIDTAKIHPASVANAPVPSSDVPRTFMQELVIRLIKLLDIGYAGAVYFICAMIVIQIFNRIGGEFDINKEEEKTTGQLLIQVIVKIWIIAMLAYVVRNLFELVPFPFEGVYGYQHLRVKEVTNSAIFFAFVVVFDSRLQSRVAILKDRFKGNNVNMKKVEKPKHSEEISSGLNKVPDVNTKTSPETSK
jgi:hypothetical protein